jgi:HK97 family phage prohead protease
MLPEGLFVKPVEGTDLVAFQFPFTLEHKALADGETTASVEELEDGDLIIEGWAADFDGVDRMDENFIPGAFQRGVKAFLEGTASLNYHHKHDTVLGRVLDLSEKETPERKGLWMRARVDHQPESSPIRYLYNQVKKGTLKGLSVGGIFKRVLTPAGYRIGDVDMTEISITNVPVHARPSFAVVAGKALEDFTSTEKETPQEYDFSRLDAVLDQFGNALDRMTEGKAVKGDALDLNFLATLLRLEQMTNNVVTSQEISEDSGDVRVDALAKRVKNYLDSVAREAHGLASELGPLPNVGSY